MCIESGGKREGWFKTRKKEAAHITKNTVFSLFLRRACTATKYH